MKTTRIATIFSSGLAPLYTTRTYAALFACACIGLLSAANQAAAAPIAAGTNIGIDFGPTPTANWNNFRQNATLPAGSVVDQKGVPVDGVSITLAAGRFFNNDGVATWKAHNADAFADLPASVTTDLVGTTGALTLSISGLSGEMAYNLSALTAAGRAWDRSDTLTVQGSGEPLTSSLPRGQSAQKGLYHSFIDLRPDDDGRIEIKVTDTSGRKNPVINMLLLEAVSRSEAAGSVETVAVEIVAVEIERQAVAEKIGKNAAKIAELQSPEKLYPQERRVHTGKYLTAVDFPVGSVGGSVIRLNGQAERHWWHIFNNHEERPGTGKVPNSFFAIRTEQGDETEVRALQTSAVGAFEAMQDLEFWSEFPFGVYDFSDPVLPVAVELEAYSFLIPMDLKNSAIPSAVFRYTVKNTSDSPVNVSLMAAQQNAVGFSGYDQITGPNERTNAGYGSNQNEIIEAANRSSLKMTGDAGSMALSLHANGASSTASWESLDTLHAEFAASGKLSGPAKASSPKEGLTVDGALAKSFTLAPGSEQTLTFLLSWHIPNGSFGKRGQPGWYFPEVGSQYENWFSNAAEVDAYVFDHFDELDGYTRSYRDALYASNLPLYVLDRISSNISVLKSPTSFWTKDGYFGIWESTSNRQEWFGNVKHVLHYAQGHARLFPELDRVLRRQDLASMLESGLLADRDGSRRPKDAMDGHYGSLLSTYRAHQLSTNDDFAKESWPQVKKSMDYAIEKYDADRDGILSGSYHNTLDCNSSGTSPWIGSLYLAALKAGEEMARIAGDDAKAQEYASIVEEGRVNQNALLWDEALGYYVERPELLRGTKIMGEGASVDMFLGQWWANQLGLGEIYPEERILSGLRHLYQNNLITDDGQYRTRWRDFLGLGDSGWRMVVFPGKAPGNALNYHNEVMSGFEYSMAATMLQYGMLEEGLTIIRTIYDRYDGRLRAEGEVRMTYNATVFGTGSPVGEDECGDFYSRALSSWSALLALQGFSYDGPERSIGFQPVWQPEDHKSFFTAAEGWGLFSQKRSGSSQTASIDLKYGNLEFLTFTLAVPDGEKVKAVQVTLDGKKLPIQSYEQTGQGVEILLQQSAQLQAGALLEMDLAL